MKVRNEDRVKEMGESRMRREKTDIEMDKERLGKWADEDGQQEEARRELRERLRKMEEKHKLRKLEREKEWEDDRIRRETAVVEAEKMRTRKWADEDRGLAEERRVFEARQGMLKPRSVPSFPGHFFC